MEKFLKKDFQSFLFIFCLLLSGFAFAYYLEENVDSFLYTSIGVSLTAYAVGCDMYRKRKRKK